MSQKSPSIVRDLGATISGTHRHVLERIFQHPLSHNLTWRDVTRLFEAIGTAEHQHNGDLTLRIGDAHHSFKPARAKDLDPNQVMDLRHLLERGGWPDETSNPPVHARPDIAPDLMIIIDHAGARLFLLHADSLTMAATETHHLHHEHIDREHRDGDREEIKTADTRFFEAVAADIPVAGRIVLVSHGEGQSNEGAHLIAYLAQRHPAIDERIVGNLVADLSHTTVPQIVHLARDTLGTTPARQTSDAR